MSSVIAAAVAVPAVFGILLMAHLRGQILHSSGPLPSFEVVSIRPWKPMPSPAPSADGTDGTTVPKKIMKAAPVGGGGQSSDRVHAIGQTAILIASAYNLPVASGSRILGGPDWVGSESNRYEIQAKIDDSLYAAMQRMTPVQQREQVALMEQSLLADRFKLKAHFEIREMPIYALLVAKAGAKLTAAKEGESAKLSTLENEQGTEITAKGVTLEQLCNHLY